ALTYVSLCTPVSSALLIVGCLADPIMCVFVLLRIKEWADQMQKDLISLTDTASGMDSLIEVNIIISPSIAISASLSIYIYISRPLSLVWCCLSDCLFLNCLCLLQINQTNKRFVPDDFQDDPDFKRKVSYNTTAVHIPTDIYNGSTIVLNELNWTEALEDVFRKNKEEDPSLLWQVFGSATGLARFFPASPWMDSSKTQQKIDLYDVRRRPWYIQGAASPKDMLILVDASGSVSGLTLKLIRTSVSEMLETLSDDDYVNVVSTAKVAACFQNLVQANVRNKKILKVAVQGITAKGITNYRGGFEKAFEQLALMNASRANCNKIIMLFTDGGEEKATEIFNKYNSDKKVRIFTFSVGQHNYDKGPIQSMACENRGYYYEIPSIGAIRINTQEYLDVLGRPMVKAGQKSKQVQWTNVYLDALELGLVITGTLPVFNRTNTRADKERGPQSQLILGVMAVDVSLEDIKRLTPRFTFGPNGYYFAIDPNGYVLLHPNLQPKNPKFQEPVTLDFLDAELEDEVKVEIRQKMIDGETGDHMISTLVKSQDERYIDRGLRSYTYAPVKGSDYSFAQRMLMSSVPSTRDYCKDLKPLKNNTAFLKEFLDYIDRKTPNNPMCNVELVNRLLLDAGITHGLSQIWKEHGVLARFVATDGGITRVYPKSAGQYWTENAETYESSFYKRNLDNDLYIFTPTPWSPTAAYENGTCVCVCVLVGVKLDIGVWMTSFINTTQRPNVSRLHRAERLWLRFHKYVDCVILDDGGFLVMSNQDNYMDQIGRFFGVMDPTLMLDLVNSSLYTFNKTFDYQSLCDPEKETRGAGPRSVYVPTIADMLNIGWWATAEDLSDSMSKEGCITQQTQYFFESSELSFKGTVGCDNCSRIYHAEKLPRTNLVFIIADARHTCVQCEGSPLVQDEQPSSSTATGPNPCFLARNPRYRKGPTNCFDDNTKVSSSPRFSLVCSYSCIHLFLYLLFSLTLVNCLWFSECAT
uniref:Calcium channel, voltage-dependent, alpha 2/delta subunit 1a n=1 Tax=Gadus morhua TaxID=8049 RepID=A0A8C5A7R3_GADMO